MRGHFSSAAVLVTACTVLGGCVAVMGAQLAGLGLSSYKLVQTSTGGSLEIGVDSTRVTEEQKSQLKTLHSIAVWPESGGTSVSLAEALSEGGRFTVVSPTQVAAALTKLQLASDLKLLTSREAKDVFQQVSRATRADAVVSTRATSSQTNMNTLSLERANITLRFVASIYAQQRNDYVATLPVTVKVLVGEKRPPSDKEISDLANAELAKSILALAQ